MAKRKSDVVVARGSRRTVTPKHTEQYVDIGKPQGAEPPVTKHPKPQEHRPEDK